MKNRPPNDEVVSEMTKRHAEPSPVSHENDDPDTEVALRPSFATGFRVGAESATLQQRRVSWGNLLWSDFTAQQPYVTSVPFSTSSDNNGKSSLVNAEPYQPKSDWPLLPRARGQLSEFVLGSFKSDSTFSRMLPSVQVADPLNDDDFQLALFVTNCTTGVCRTSNWNGTPSCLAFDATWKTCSFAVYVATAIKSRVVRNMRWRRLTLWSRRRR